MSDNTVYLDTEGTGLDPECESMLEIAIVSDAGRVLLNTLIAPRPDTIAGRRRSAFTG